MQGLELPFLSNWQNFYILIGTAAATLTGLMFVVTTIVDLAGSEEILSPHLAEALHASQSSQVDDGLAVYSVPIKSCKLK
ncbi:MAG TPA: hypothetical protein VFR47_32340 [Anaerolineales bacterium]|nr:hypothetical protein [Anaerolineales bacterium]